MNSRLNATEQAILDAMPKDGTTISNAKLADITCYPKPSIRRSTLALENKGRIRHSTPDTGVGNLWSIPVESSTSASV